ncbi:uncharacterized protein LOC117392576 [Periophthalmus magnuspinnatus]|uniref:uncharacterized protein LOC117392576 n=1 Tax=Periophthalmus magnuspinnatus TaxID=409849 RepID=UPI00145A5CC3|nr:uncharacterized protein LOC117392576 [Periophthalmus magnuspinnatus]
MADFTNLLGIRIFISCIGCFGNVVLIFSIAHSHAKISAVKSFEVFLLGLAVSNLEEILIVNIYDILIHQNLSTETGTWSCCLLKFLTLSGELSSISFTVVICIFRYEKVKHAAERVNVPTHFNNVTSAILVSFFCFVISFSLSSPVFILRVHSENETTSCAPGFSQCDDLHCPTENCTYKYIFIVVCNILPMLVVTVTSCRIIAGLLHQRKNVEPGIHASGSRNFCWKTHRSTVAVLAAMGLFQVDWSLYLIFHFYCNGSNFVFWNEMKFFISTSYTSISPYVFGIGNNLFSIKHFVRK